MARFSFAPALLIAAVAGVAWPSAALPAAPACLVDGDIPYDTRQEVEQVAWRFVGQILDGKFAPAYAAMSDDARKTSNNDRLQAFQRDLLRNVGSIAAPWVEHSYLITDALGGQAPIICIPFGKPGEAIAATPRARPLQAFVIIQSRAPDSDVAFTLWLVGGDGWRVLDFRAARSTAGGRTSDDFLKLAREEAKQGRLFNADLFYATAHTLLSRGGNFEYLQRVHIEQEWAEPKRPPQLKGKPPYRWEVGGKTFVILGLSVRALRGKIYAVVAHELDKAASDDDAEEANRQLLEELQRRFPEYDKAFTGFVVDAIADKKIKRRNFQ